MQKTIRGKSAAENPSWERSLAVKRAENVHAQKWICYQSKSLDFDAYGLSSFIGSARAGRLDEAAALGFGYPVAGRQAGRMARRERGPAGSVRRTRGRHGFGQS